MGHLRQQRPSWPFYLMFTTIMVALIGGSIIAEKVDWPKFVSVALGFPGYVMSLYWVLLTGMMFGLKWDK